MTNTKIKFILVVDSLNSAFRENEIRTIFRNIHQEYVNFISNPFIVPNEPIFSKYAPRILIDGELLHKFIFFLFLIVLAERSTKTFAPKSTATEPSERSTLIKQNVMNILKKKFPINIFVLSKKL